MTYDPEIEKLLPWYAKGLLEPDDIDKVDVYLAAHPDMRMQLDLIAHEGAAIEQQHAALAAPGAGGLDRLLADIDALEAQKAPLANAVAGGLTSKIKAFLANFSSPGMQFAGMAAALVIVAQGVVIGGLMQSEPVASTGYRTASGPEQSAVMDGVVFLVAFDKDARMADVAQLLKSQSAKIIAGPKAGGFYEIQVASNALPEGGAKVILEQLRAKSDLVQFASLSQ